MMYLQILNTYKDNYHKVNKEDREDLKRSIRSVFDMLPDMDLAMITLDQNTSWISRGNISLSEYKLATLYKRNNKYSRYKDGSGETDPVLFLLYNSGFIYTKEEAKALLLDPETEVSIREVSNISETEGISRSRTYKL